MKLRAQISMYTDRCWALPNQDAPHMKLSIYYVTTTTCYCLLPQLKNHLTSITSQIPMHTLDFGQQEKVKAHMKFQMSSCHVAHYYVIEVTAFSPAQPSLIVQQHHHSYI